MSSRDSEHDRNLETGATVDRRDFLRQGLAAGAALSALSVAACTPPDDGASGAQKAVTELPAASGTFELEETTMSALQAGMESGKYTSRYITELYLARIEAVDRGGVRLSSVIEINADALAIAEAMDAERRGGKVRGPLHGVPILIKDNIDTGDKMKTSAGSMALAEFPAPKDAEIVRRLREAGAVLIGKTNLSEWANIRSNRSVSGWSARGGLTKNPYALDRNACGSSSGTGASISANLAAIGVGTETDGSIICPSNVNGLVGIKPTVGLVSRSGIVPISHSQDTAGPMCRSVRDAAALLTVLAGADASDPATTASQGHVEADYTTFCDANGLKGARIGVVREWFNAGPHVDREMVTALDAIKAAGAELIDPVAVPSVGEIGQSELDVLLYELKADLAAYLAARGATSRVKTLADVIAFNTANKDREMPYFGQELFELAEAKGPLTDAGYRTALTRCRSLARDRGMDRVLKQHNLDALIAPSGGPAWMTDLVNGDHFGGGSSTLCAVAGYPAITVPAGAVFGLPVGITFMGPAWSEGKLVRYAYAFEQATKARRAPRFLPTAAT